jgi:hypothetical protein
LISRCAQFVIAKKKRKKEQNNKRKFAAREKPSCSISGKTYLCALLFPLSRNEEKKEEGSETFSKEKPPRANSVFFFVQTKLSSQPL